MPWYTLYAACCFCVYIEIKWNEIWLYPDQRIESLVPNAIGVLSRLSDLIEHNRKSSPNLIGYVQYRGFTVLGSSGVDLTMRFSVVLNDAAICNKVSDGFGCTSLDPWVGSNQIRLLPPPPPPPPQNEMQYEK